MQPPLGFGHPVNVPIDTSTVGLRFNMRMPAPPRGALAKIGRAQQHHHELLGVFNAWGIASPIGEQVVAIAEDRLSWSLRLGEVPEPPLATWALIAGDAIHNLRSALDVAVFELADAKSLKPKEQQRVALPVVGDPNQWAAPAKRLAVLPADLVERIASLQPFQRPEAERATDGLALLHTLDIADKHRLPLTASVITNGQVEHSFLVEYEVEPDPSVEPDVTVHEPVLASGAMLVEQRTTERVAKVSGSVTLKFELSLDLPGVGPVPVSQYLDRTALYVRQLVSVLAGEGITG